MNGTLSLPPSLIVRDLFLTAWSKMRLILLLVACVMAITLQIAFQTEPSYQAKSTLLVLMGAEHAFRPAAGQQFVNNGGVDVEQVLRTEFSILASDDLHRSVVREIGLARMYPKLLQPPSAFSVWLKETKASIFDLFGAPQPGGGEAANDPLVRAVDNFAADLTINTDKKSSVIELQFINPDRQVASDVLAVLEKQYLALRSKLYGDVQAPIVQVRKEAVGKQLSDADAALATFKHEHDISSFSERRAILLRQQGDLESGLAKAEAAVAEQQARLNQLTAQLASATGAKHGSPNAAAALQGMVEAFKQREVQAQTTYRGSPAVDDARRQMLERQTDVAKMQSTQAFTLQTDRNKAEADLRASSAGRDAIKVQLADLNKQIDAVNAEEIELHRLERTRGILEDNFKAVSKILDERQVLETVDANRESSIRVIQPPRAPTLPRPMRQMIFMVGVIISMVLAAAITLLSHFMRASYLRPEALEFDTGLIVLASVPETKALGRSSLLIGPA